MSVLRIDTPHGEAAVTLHCTPGAVAALLLGHGAGGGIAAPDLVTATRAAQRAGVDVALVEQPYRVAGRRAPAAAGQLDSAWLAVADELGRRTFTGMPLVFGGRSSGARVACRTSTAGGAVAVLCLAFPVHPPGKPHLDRLAELDGVEAPVLVVQGERDRFGVPPASRHREVALLRGDHSLRTDLEGVDRAVGEWLQRVLRPLNP